MELHHYRPEYVDRERNMDAPCAEVARPLRACGHEHGLCDHLGHRIDHPDRLVADPVRSRRQLQRAAMDFARLHAFSGRADPDRRRGKPIQAVVHFRRGYCHLYDCIHRLRFCVGERDTDRQADLSGHRCGFDGAAELGDYRCVLPERNTRTSHRPPGFGVRANERHRSVTLPQGVLSLCGGFCLSKC